MGKIVAFGEIMLRLSPNGNYRLFQTDQMQAIFGGAEANVAVSLTNYGESVSYVTKLPDNIIGQSAINSLRYFGIDTSAIARGGDRVGIYYMEKGSNQRPSVCIYDRAGSSIQKATTTDFDWDLIFNDADWFHFTGITPALGENLVEVCKEACIEAKKRNIKVSCDLNYRSKLWTRDSARSAMTEICSYVDICIGNEEDAKDVFGLEGIQIDEKTGEINRDGYINVAKALHKEFGFEKIAFTFRTSHSASVNDWKAMLFDGEHFYLSKNYHFDNIVDRIGGGDSFSGALIYALRKGYDDQRAIEFAVAASALKHTIEGDVNRVTVEEVERLASGDKLGRVQR